MFNEFGRQFTPSIYDTPYVDILFILYLATF